MRKIIAQLLLITSTLLALPLQAADTIPRKQISVKLAAYAQAIGCQYDFDENNLLRIDESDSNQPLYNDGEPVYVALFAIDPGCSGGNSTQHPALAIVRQSLKYDDKSGEPEDVYFIDAERSFPAAPLVSDIRWADGIQLKGKALHLQGAFFDQEKGDYLLKLRRMEIERKDAPDYQGSHYYWWIQTSNP